MEAGAVCAQVPMLRWGVRRAEPEAAGVLPGAQRDDDAELARTALREVQEVSTALCVSEGVGGMTCQAPRCTRELTGTQAKYCSRSCAGKGVPNASRRIAGQRGGPVKARREWAKFMLELKGRSPFDMVRLAYQRGYAKGRRHRVRAGQGS